MNWYHIALLVGALGALILAWDVPRATLWIMCGVASFVTSYFYHISELPYPAVFGAATNLAVCFAIYAKAQLQYEMRVWNCFHLMIVIDLLYLSGWINSRYDFAVGLEIANWLALLIIGTAGVAERSGFGPLGLFALRARAGWPRALLNRLWGERENPPFWQVAR